MNMDEVVNGSLEEPKVEAAEPEQVEPVVEIAEGVPTAPAAESQHVPLAALESERKSRQDWKEKAIRYEEELKQLRQPVQQPEQQTDPLQSMQQQIVNERFNNSEMIARTQYKDVDEKVAVFMEAAKANPALSIALQQQRHPWEFAYKEGQRLLMLKEVGDDPAAYRARVEAEVRASLETPAAPALKLPQSLAGVRSAAPRSAPGYTGPPPFEEIVNSR